MMPPKADENDSMALTTVGGGANNTNENHVNLPILKKIVLKLANVPVLEKYVLNLQPTLDEEAMTVTAAGLGSEKVNEEGFKVIVDGMNDKTIGKGQNVTSVLKETLVCGAPVYLGEPFRVFLDDKTISAELFIRSKIINAKLEGIKAALSRAVECGSDMACINKELDKPLSTSVVDPVENAGDMAFLILLAAYAFLVARVASKKAKKNAKFNGFLFDLFLSIELYLISGRFIEVANMLGLQFAAYHLYLLMYLRYTMLFVVIAMGCEK